MGGNLLFILLRGEGDTISNAEAAQREQSDKPKSAGCAPQMSPEGNICQSCAEVGNPLPHAPHPLPWLSFYGLQGDAGASPLHPPAKR